jgi:hypothetical protein
MEAAVPEVIDVLRATVVAGINPRRALQAASEGAPPTLEPVLRQAVQVAERAREPDARWPTRPGPSG